MRGLEILKWWNRPPAFEQLWPASVASHPTPVHCSWSPGGLCPVIPFQIPLGRVLSHPALPWAGVWIAPPLLRPKNMLIFVFWVLAKGRLYSLRSQTEFSLKLLNESFCKKHFAMWAFPLPSPSLWHQESSEFRG